MKEAQAKIESMKQKKIEENLKQKDKMVLNEAKRIKKQEKQAR